MPATSLFVAGSASASTRSRRWVSAPAASGRSTPSTTRSAPRDVHAGDDRGRAPRRSGATQGCFPLRHPGNRGSRPGSRHCSPPRGSRAALGIGELCAEARHREPDALVQGPRRRRRRAKAQELGRTTLACSSTGNLANAVAARAAAEGIDAAVFCPADLEPEKLVATAVYGATIYAVDGSYDDCTGSRSSSPSSSTGRS